MENPKAPTKVPPKTITKSFTTLDTPLKAPSWPSLPLEHATTILELLCSVVAPIGEHRRRHVVPSKGKRSRKRKRASAKDTSDAGQTVNTPPVPDIHSFTTVGFNSTIRCLQNHMNFVQPHRKQPPDEKDSRVSESDLDLAAIFVDRASVADLLWEKLPLLVHTQPRQNPSMEPIRLVSLPRGSEARLSDGFGIPRAGIVGIARGAPGAEQLMSFVRAHADPIEIPWLRDLKLGNYFPAVVDVKTVEVPAPKSKKAKEAEQAATRVQAAEK